MDIFEAHQKALEERYTPEELKGVNFGWSQEDDVICSKVYKAKRGVMIFETIHNIGKHTYSHNADYYN
jgi:hypothetical protein